MPYMSAAEKRRQRAVETANDMSEERMFDGFGRNEKTGIGGRANQGESVTRVQVPAIPTHAAQDVSPRNGHAPPGYYGQQPPHLSPGGGGAGRYQASDVSAVAPSSVMPPPGYYHSPPHQRQPPQLSQVSSALPYNRGPPVVSALQFDPEMFGNNATPKARRNAPPMAEKWAEPVPQPAIGRSAAAVAPRPRQTRGLPAMEYTPPPPSSVPGGALYEPHPLEYDGGDPLPDVIVDSHFGGKNAHLPSPGRGGAAGVAQGYLNASSRALEEYYNRTNGPIIDDSDRAAIEDFFATDDFTEQYNARAAAMRAANGQHKSPQRAVASDQRGAAAKRQLPPLDAPAVGGPSSNVSYHVPDHSTRQGAAYGGGDDDDDDGHHYNAGGETLYPLCHRCHQAVVVAAEAQERQSRAKAGPKSRAVSGQPKRPPRKVPAMKPTTSRMYH